MSLDETISMDSVISTPIEGAKWTEKPKKILRPELLSEGMLVLTKKLDLKTSVRLNFNTLLWRFEKITHPQMKEHLLKEEEDIFVKEIDIENVPIGWMIEVWVQIPDSNEYVVTEYKKLK